LDRIEEQPETEPGSRDLVEALDALGEEVARLRRCVLKQGHAQELFQGRLEQEMRRFARRLEAPVALRGGEPESPHRFESQTPSSAQLRALVELDRAVLHLLDLFRGSASAASSEEISPRSVEEGLVLLQIRARNLQRSFGLEPIPALGLPFDDSVHQAHGACERSDLPDGQVAEELLPGYRLGGRVLRPALVIVNRRVKSQGGEA
jgi:molecular chaperone GrpE